MSPSRRPSTPSYNGAERSLFARTSGNMLVGGPDSGYYGPGINPSETAPAIWWMGSDGGGSWDGEPIGPHGPFATGPGRAVVTRATSLITGPLSAAPYRVLSDGQSGVPAPVPRFLSDPCLLRPDQRVNDAVFPAVLKLPRSEFWASWIRSAIWCGLGVYLCQEDESGQPLAGSLRLVERGAVSTERVDGSVRWVIDAGGERATFSRDGYLSLGPVTYRIVVLRNPHSPVDVDGISRGVFEMNPGAFRLAGQIEGYTSGQFRSGVPAGYLSVLTPGLQEEDATELRAKWLRHHGGDRRSIAVLSSTVQFTPINLSPVDAAIGEVSRLAIGDVAYAFGLSPETLGVTLANSAMYQNVRDAWLNHRDFGLAPWTAAVQDTLSALLPGTAGVVVNFDGFANPPLKERVETGAAAVAAGLITVDEWRASEGMQPLPEPVVPPQLVIEPDTTPPEDDQAQRHLRIQPWRG